MRKHQDISKIFVSIQRNDYFLNMKFAQLKLWNTGFLLFFTQCGFNLAHALPLKESHFGNYTNTGCNCDVVAVILFCDVL